MVSSSGILGYGFPESSLKAGLARQPHMIGVDGGSSDPGPHYLGSGKAFTNRLSIKRDLSLLVRGALANKIPMMIGTIVAACSVAIAMVFSPETKGTQLVADIQLA